MELKLTLYDFVGDGTCKDALTNCNEYSQEACMEPYVEWAKANCPVYCGLCGKLV